MKFWNLSYMFYNMVFMVYLQKCVSMYPYHFPDYCSEATIV